MVGYDHICTALHRFERADPSVCYRDALGLGMLVLGHGGRIPGRAWEKAHGAYGEDILRDVRWVVGHLEGRPVELERAAGALRMDLALARNAIGALARACEGDAPPPPREGTEPAELPGPLSKR